MRRTLLARQGPDFDALNSGTILAHAQPHGIGVQNHVDISGSLQVGAISYRKISFRTELRYQWTQLGRVNLRQLYLFEGPICGLVVDWFQLECTFRPAIIPLQ